MIKPDWIKLTNFKHYKPFFPTNEKIAKLTKEFKDGYLNLSDEYRNQYSIYNILLMYFNNPANLFYEIGNFGGVLGFANIVGGHKCDILMKMWDKEIWKPSVVKEAKEIIKTIMDEFKLIRINTETADIRVKKMCTILGFKEDGIREKDFSFDGKKFSLFLLSMEK